MTQAERLVAEARSYMGVRWLHQGRTRAGIDCVGLIAESARAVIGRTFDKSGYPRQAKDESMLDYCREHLITIRRSQLRAGDVVVMAFSNQRHMALVGEVDGRLTIIHAYVVNRKVVEQSLDEQWRDRIVGCFRFHDEVKP